MNRMVSGTALTIILLIAVSAASPRTWVYFTDKGTSDSAALRAALEQETERLQPRTKARLLKVRDMNDIITERDLPVSAQYLAIIEGLTGQKPHAVSRWLNAASFAFDAGDIALVKGLSCAASVQPVRQLRADREIAAEPSSLKQQYRTLADSAFYGTSYNQNALENFPPAHEAGYHGEGVLVGMLDAGWNNLAHVCFDSLEIVATWDFVNGDSSVADDPGQPESGTHGTKTLSCMAGFEEGELIGTAYGISVALAKTENTIGEMPVEEDNWAAGIEWLDSLGCQVVTSSLSYTYFDDATGYDYEERDGNTAVVTIAGDYAVSRGIVVLNSNGNKGGYAYPDNKMSVPADGDSVLACGSMAYDSTKSSFSSLGPTYDGRIKPDLVALGQNVRVARTSDTTGYSVGSGTSFSTPITAGACAILLQADPGLTPLQVHQFLKETAHNAASPDTLIGWGVYDVWQAVQNVLAPVDGPGSDTEPTDFRLLSAYPNPFNSSVLLAFQLERPGEVRISIYALDGKLISNHSEWYMPGYNQYRQHFDAASSGIYLCRLVTDNQAVTTKLLYLK